MSRSRPKIPFMMFQDVIMAVFGILILIVIYLLINAKVSDIEFVEILEDMREEKALLGDSIQIAEAQRSALYEDAVKEIETREMFELGKQAEANREQIETFDAQMSTLQIEVQAQEDKLKKTVSERFEKHPGVVRTREEIFKQQAEIDGLKDTIRDVKSEAEKTERIIATTQSYLEKIENQFRVEIDESLADESVYLVDFSGHDIRAFRIYNGEQKRVGSKSANTLLAEVQSDPEKKRVFFFVRPDAVNEFNQALLDFRNSNIPVGYQPVPAGEELIFTKFPEGVPALDGHVSSGTDGLAGAGGGGREGEATSGGGSEVTMAAKETQNDASKTVVNETGSGAAPDENMEAEEASPQIDTADQGQPAGGGMAESEQEASGTDQWTFNWWILLLLLVLILAIVIMMKGSRK